MLEFIQVLTWMAACLRPPAVLYSLTGRTMGRESVYRSCDFSEVLQNWRDKFATENGKRYLSTDMLKEESNMSASGIPVTNFMRLRAHTNTTDSGGMHWKFLDPWAGYN